MDKVKKNSTLMRASLGRQDTGRDGACKPLQNR
jgi:hypothetical protein